MLNRTSVFACLFVASPLIGAAAQTRSAPGCWLRPAPAPTCSGFLVTEATAEFPLEKRSENEFDSRFTLGVGYMHNLGTARSVGGVVAWDVGRGWARPARGEVRYRHWLSPVALDLGAGIAQRGVTAADGSGESRRAYGPTGLVSVEWRYIALDARGELLRGEGRTFSDVYLGARATSAGAPIAALAGLALIFAVVAAAGPT
jgi:hypothetical protein